MPELPEVETMVRDLASRVAGSTIVSVEADFPGIVVWPAFDQFVQRVAGQMVSGVERRGKFAIFPLASGDALIVHRGMTGNLLLRTPESPLESHVRLMFVLDDGRELRFNDPRKFGKIYLMHPSGSERALPWSRMGPEPLNGDFTLRSFRQSLRGRTALIKPLLLSQGLVAGLGNIYVDEALHLARVHPQRRAGTLKPAELSRVYQAIREVLEAAIEGRGTTFSNYTDIEGRAGRYQDRLRVYGKTGTECLRCGFPIVKMVVGGRGTHVCPHCQKV